MKRMISISSRTFVLMFARCVSMQVQYFPQLGYLISLPLSTLRRIQFGEEDAAETSIETNTLPEIDGLRFEFTSNVDVFYKCMARVLPASRSIWLTRDVCPKSTGNGRNG